MNRRLPNQASTIRFRVSGTRCSTYVILPAFLQSRALPAELRAHSRQAYDPFFHARAMKRPVPPESTWRALARFRARASGELRREK
jgi:hypothetical protein